MRLDDTITTLDARRDHRDSDPVRADQKNQLLEDECRRHNHHNAACANTSLPCHTTVAAPSSRSS
jgi:hypothetical protein